MPSTFDQMLRRAMSAWGRLAGREQILLAVLALVGLIAVTLLSLDWSARQRDAHALAAEVAGSQASLRRNQLVGPDSHQLRLLDEGAVQGSDIWMARIALEQLLVAATETAGVATPRIVIGEPDETVGALPVLHAEIVAPYDGGALIRLLEALAAGHGVYFVESLSVEKGEAAEFRLSLSFPAHLAEDGPRT